MGRSGRRTVPLVLAAGFAILAVGMVVIHQQDKQQSLLEVRGRRAALRGQMHSFFKLLGHPNKLAAAMTGDTKYTKAKAKKVPENNAAKTIAAERAEIALLTAQNAVLARNARLQRALKASKQQNPIERAIDDSLKAVTKTTASALGEEHTQKSQKMAKAVRRSKLMDQGKQKIARSQLDEAEEDSSEENYYHSSFPTTNRKGIGPGLSIGDPVLNRLNKYKMAPPACLAKGNCVEEGDTSHDDWRALKQRSPTADEDMEHQLAYIFRDSEIGLEACQEGFGEDEVRLEQCEKKVGRKVCYKFESLNAICDESLSRRSNEIQGTVYFDEAFQLKACTNDVRMAFLDMCKEAEKIPGINVDHWPWQGHSMNLGIRGFSGDAALGPYYWSNRQNAFGS